MAITATANPQTLTWAHFTVVPDKIVDAHDGTLQHSYTTFRFEYPGAPGDFNVIAITPRAQVWNGVKQTEALLSHEQLHYDVGFVVARALARDLTRLRTRTLVDLENEFRNAFDLHFERRALLIQTRYDRETEHGANRRSQRIWKDAMARCLADPRAGHILGWQL
jgi:hypothetical protein